MLKWHRPDSLADTITLPLITTEVDGHSILDESGPVRYLMLGIRKWYVSTPTGSEGGHLLFSSDPLGVVVGRIWDPFIRDDERVSRRDTVEYLDFILNKPQPKDSRGNITSYRTPQYVRTPAGRFFSFPYVSSDDTLYLTPGVGITRVVLRGSDNDDVFSVDLTDYSLQ
jgi:hypothetical protein